MQFKKFTALFLTFGIASASFASVTFYNKSVDTLTIGYKICSWDQIDANSWVVKCPEDITKLPPIDKNKSYTLSGDIDPNGLYVYTVDATTPNQITFTKQYPTFSMSGAEVTQCGASNEDGNSGLQFTAYNDAKDITCVNSTGAVKRK